jgi:hypothetical protein
VQVLKEQDALRLSTKMSIRMQPDPPAPPPPAPPAHGPEAPAKPPVAQGGGDGGEGEMTFTAIAASPRGVSGPAVDSSLRLIPLPVPLSHSA